MTLHTRAITALLVATLFAGCSDSKDGDMVGMPLGGMAAGTGAGAGGDGSAGTAGGAGGAGGTSTAGTGAGTGAPPMGTDGAAFAEIVPVYAEAYCGVLARCLPPALAGLAFGGADCDARVIASLEDSELEEIQGAIDAGRVVYDPTKVDACFAMIEAVACTDSGARLFDEGPCGAVVTGTVTEGGDCGLDAECAGDTFCDRTTGCPGTCTKARGAGEGCDRDEQCLAPLSCDEDTMKCATPGKAGDSCGGGVSPDCTLGLFCAGDDPDMMKAGTCKTTSEVFAAANGATCDFDTTQLCMDGLACVVSVSGMTPTFACSEPVASGASCNFAIPSQCPAGEYCDGINLMTGDVDGTCTPLPGDGQPCARHYGAACAGDLVCDMDRRCHPLGRIDDPCVSGGGCASGRCVAEKCVRPERCEVR